MKWVGHGARMTYRGAS